MNDYPAIQQFRIWSPEEKKYYYSGGTPSMLSSFFLQTATLHTVHKMPYQRGTFLHDKNGKEIYEGDIVSIPSTCYENPQIEVVEIRVEKDHTHRDAFFECFPFNSYLQSEDCYGTASESEVIGNIYENPDLLTKDKQP